MDLKKKAKKYVPERRGKKIADPLPPPAPVAQGDGDPAPISVDDKIAALRSELLERIAPPANEPDAFTSDEHGRIVAPRGSRELFIRDARGTRHEHVAETADGRWVYAPS